MRLRVFIERERVLVQSFGMRGPALNAGNCDTYMVAGSKPLSRGAGKSRAGAIFERLFFSYFGIRHVGSQRFFFTKNDILFFLDQMVIFTIFSN